MRLLRTCYREKHQRPHTSPTGSTATEMKISVLLSLWQQLLAKQPLQTVWFHTEMVARLRHFFFFFSFCTFYCKKTVSINTPSIPDPPLFWLSRLLLKEIKAIKSTNWTIWGDLLSNNSLSLRWLIIFLTIYIFFQTPRYAEAEIQSDKKPQRLWLLMLWLSLLPRGWRLVFVMATAAACFNPKQPLWPLTKCFFHPHGCWERRKAAVTPPSLPPTPREPRRWVSSTILLLVQRVI